MRTHGVVALAGRRRAEAATPALAFDAADGVEAGVNEIKSSPWGISPAHIRSMSATTAPSARARQARGRGKRAG